MEACCAKPAQHQGTLSHPALPCDAPPTVSKLWLIRALGWLIRAELEAYRANYAKQQDPEHPEYAQRRQQRQQQTAAA